MNPDQASIAVVIRAVANVSGFRPMEFLSIKRLHNRSTYAHARTMVIATVAAEFPRLDHDQLAEIFHRDSMSINYTLRRHNMLLATVPAYQQLHSSVQQALTAPV